MQDKNKLCSELKVIKKIQETEDTVSLVLEIPAHLHSKFRYRAGQFVTLFLDDELRRSYSLASSPDCDVEFKITVKLVPGGRGSSYLVNKVTVGDTLWVTPPAGHFCMPKIFENDLSLHFLFYAAGSGITPIISMIKSALRTIPNARCGLFYQNRFESNIIFKAELDGLQMKYSPSVNSDVTRFQIEYALSSAGPNWAGLRGRIDLKMLRDFLSRQNMSVSTRHFVCGPEGFMQMVLDTLAGEGVSKDTVMKESFSTPNDKVANADKKLFSPPADGILVGDKTALDVPETIETIIDGESHIINYLEGETILNCLLDAKLNPPYSCMDGACMACIAKVEEGLVYQNELGILSDDNIEAKECLTCQARPASKIVKIHYETF